VKRFIGISAAVLATAISTSGRGQTPDFGGTWTVVSPSRSEVGGPSGLFVGGSEFTATQDKGTLTVLRPRTKAVSPSLKFVLNLDGSPSKNRVEIGGEIRDTTSTVSWSESRLVVVTRYKVGERALEHTQTLFIDRSGNLLVEQTTISKAPQGETSSKWEWTYKRR
jgi:hypothetical protein